MKAKSFWTSDKLLWGIAVFLFAFVVRVIFLRQAATIPLFTIPIMDMEYHFKWAQALIKGMDYIGGPFFRAPLYPYFLALIYTISGASVLAAQTVQIVLGSFSAVLVYMIGSRVFDLKTGVVAGLIMSVYGTLIFFEGLLLIPTLIIFLNLCAVLLIVIAIEKNWPLIYFGAGILLGLSAIARPTVLSFVAVLGIWLLIRIIKKRGGIAVKTLGIFVLGVVIPIVPVTLHNLHESGHLTIIGTYGGLNFYIGNNSRADGVSANIPGARRDWWGMMEDAERIANNESGRILSPSEQSSFWMKKGLSESSRSPGQFVARLFKKVILLIEGNELSNNFDFYFFAHRSSELRLLIWYKYFYLPFGLILPLAVVGILMTGWKNFRARPLLIFLIAYTPAVVLFFVTARYRLPMVPFLILFAAYCVMRIPSIVREASPKRALIYTLVFVAMLVLCNTDIYGYRKKNDAQGFYTMASLYARMGDDSQEAYFYKRAISQDTTLSEAYNNLGLLDASHGNVQEALTLLRKATQLAPANFMYQYNLGYLYLQSGKPDSAIEPLRQVVTVTPQNLYALNNLGMAYLNTHNFDSAVAVFRQAVDTDSTFANGYYNLAITYQQLGRNDSAIAYFKKELAFDSTDADAVYNLGLLSVQTRDLTAAESYFNRYLKMSSDSSADAAQVRGLLDSLGRGKNH
ncbi:MAG TPA: tetratricopeptide repeat protein [candidate division Zixibacteria bacterium]|nr:tetratricopeptide repeat protein [candidate division Zixibacteria bacterium]